MDFRATEALLESIAPDVDTPLLAERATAVPTRARPARPAASACPSATPRLAAVVEDHHRGVEGAARGDARRHSGHRPRGAGHVVQPPLPRDLAHPGRRRREG